MKKTLIICTIIFLISGCSTKNSKDNTITPTFTKDTVCNMTNYTIKNDPDGISSYEYTIHIYYNNLDDKQTYLETFSLLDFNSWNKAKTYYDKHKEEYQDLNIELSEEDIDTDNTGTITTSTEGIEKNSPRQIIEEQKNNGFECNTYDVEKYVNIE